MQPYVVSGAAWWQRGSCVTACILSLSKPRNIQQVKKIVINNLWGAVKHFNLSCRSLYGGFHGSWEVIFFVLLNIYIFYLFFISRSLHTTLRPLGLLLSGISNGKNCCSFPGEAGRWGFRQALGSFALEERCCRKGRKECHHLFKTNKPKKKKKARKGQTSHGVICCRRGKNIPHVPKSAKFLKNSNKRNVYQIGKYDYYC